MHLEQQLEAWQGLQGLLHPFRQHLGQVWHERVQACAPDTAILQHFLCPTIYLCKQQFASIYVVLIHADTWVQGQAGQQACPQMPQGRSRLCSSLSIAVLICTFHQL